MLRTTITFWGGLHTIGGNIAEIVYGKDRIIFDFGLVYNPANSILQMNVKRKESYVVDLLKLNAIPAIDGIYSKEDLAAPSYSVRKPIPEEASPYQTAVFISHLHLDHMGAMDTISEKIPVYMSEESKCLFRALEHIGDGLVFNREWNGLSFGEPIHIGEIKVTPYRVDHDVIGAASYLIETPDLNILYSGDLRMHGNHPEYVEEWIQDMKKKGIDILLMEGTSFKVEQEKVASLCRREAEIETVAARIMQQNNGLSIFNIYHRNIERISQFLNAAQTSNRIPVLEPETAYLANAFFGNSSFMVYMDNEQIGAQLEEKLSKYKTISSQTINQEPAKYVLQNSFNHINRLLDLDLTDSVYLHSNGMPLGPFDPAFQTMHIVLEHFGVSYESLDVSGHATTEDILYMIEQINPRILIPWHSLYPELVKPRNSQISVFLPEIGKEYRF